MVITMKKLIIYFLGIRLVGLSFGSCTPDVIESIDQSKLPQVSGMKANTLMRPASSVRTTIAISLGTNTLTTLISELSM